MERVDVTEGDDEQIDAHRVWAIDGEAVKGELELLKVQGVPDTQEVVAQVGRQLLWCIAHDGTKEGIEEGEQVMDIQELIE